LLEIVGGGTVDALTDLEAIAEAALITDTLFFCIRHQGFAHLGWLAVC
jgi:hypothetical protein